MSSKYSKKEAQQRKANKTQVSSSGNTTVTPTSAHIEQQATASNDEKQEKATSNPHVSSPCESPRTIIAYVQNLSPIKRNRKNTVDYATLSLQTDATTIQPALCFSKTKRKLLEEKETTRSPVKITRFTTSNDLTKIVINDKTMITAPSDLEYNFQYSETDSEINTPLRDLTDENSVLDQNITVCAKVVKIHTAKSVTSSQSKVNKVAEVLLLDETDKMRLDLWNNQITQVSEGCAYRFTSLAVTSWNNVKKLSSTFNTLIKQTFDVGLCSLQFDEDIPQVIDEHQVQVPSICTIEDIQRYKTCCNCNKRINQVDVNVLRCDHCGHRMRTSDCPIKLYANIVIMVEGQKKSLTVFEECLKAGLGDFDHESIDTKIIEDRLLLSATNLQITYNERNVVTNLQIG